ncbi:MAG TPA: hypothetical protein VJB16_01320, partial [archaeon]|nr:hypothetical protein [archaeon]
MHHARRTPGPSLLLQRLLLLELPFVGRTETDGYRLDEVVSGAPFARAEESVGIAQKLAADVGRLVQVGRVEV